MALRLFHTDATGKLATRPASELGRARGDGGWLWLDVTDPTRDEITRIGDEFHFNPLSLDDVMDVTLFPKVDRFDDHVFIVLHGVVTGDDRLTTRELDLFIGADYVVSVHHGEIAGVEIVAAHAGSSEVGHLGPGPFGALIAQVSSRRYFPLLDSLDARIEDVEELALAGDSRTLTETQALRRDVIVLRRILGPQRDVLRELTQPTSTVLDERSRRAFADAYDLHFRMVESLDSARALLSGALESYRGAMAERTNEVMKVLTVFSAILLPLSLVAGIYGMNFADLPGSGWRWGFLALLGAMTVIAVGLWVYFSRRGFVGGPKLRDLPKAVGLGLVHIGTAPIRGVFGTIGRLVPSDERVMVSPTDHDAEGREG